MWIKRELGRCYLSPSYLHKRQRKMEKQTHICVSLKNELALSSALTPVSCCGFEPAGRRNQLLSLLSNFSFMTRKKTKNTAGGLFLFFCENLWHVHNGALWQRKDVKMRFMMQKIYKHTVKPNLANSCITLMWFVFVQEKIIVKMAFVLEYVLRSKVSWCRRL